MAVATEPPPVEARITLYVSFADDTLGPCPHVPIETLSIVKSKSKYFFILLLFN